MGGHLRRISFAWRSSRFSRSSALIFAAVSLEMPARCPLSTSVILTQLFNVFAEHPIFAAIPAWSPCPSIAMPLSRKEARWSSFGRQRCQGLRPLDTGGGTADVERPPFVRSTCVQTLISNVILAGNNEAPWRQIVVSAAAVPREIGPSKRGARRMWVMRTSPSYLVGPAAE